MNKKMIDGNSAAAHIAYMTNDISFIYPITPSSTMSEQCSIWNLENKKNIFDQTMQVVEMQSEAGAIGSVHGALSAGSLTTTFTSSQGLLLMIPNMYKIAGENLPNVIYVAARTLSTHALNIFCDHSDIYATLKTGYNIVACNSVQEVNDLSLAVSIASIKSSLPFLIFFDGFRTSHELCTIEQFTAEEIKSVFPFEIAQKFKNSGMNSSAPITRGTAQNPDTFYQNRLASQPAYNNVLTILKDSMKTISKLSGRNYDTLEYFGDSNAENVIIAMGSSTTTLKNAVEYLNSKGGKFGVVTVRSLAPFDSKLLLELLPTTVKNITTLDRNVDFNNENVLYSKIISTLYPTNRKIEVLSGNYGLGGKEFDINMAIATLENMINDKKNNFSVGINDDLSHTNLKVENKYIANNTNFSIRTYGIGSDGSVSASKTLGKILGNALGKNLQCYVEYDSKKSGSLTTSHIRLSDNDIMPSYNSQSVDVLMSNNQSFGTKYSFAKYIKPNGKLLLNIDTNNIMLDKESLDYIKENNIKVFAINANKIAKENNLGNKINHIMTSAFLQIINNKNIDKDVIENQIKQSLKGKRKEIIDSNILAVQQVKSELFDVDIKNISSVELSKNTTDNQFINEVLIPIASLTGNDTPVSKFNANGTIENGTSQYEKRGITTCMPIWQNENCIQCNRCSLVCPHAAIRPHLIQDENSDKIKSNNAIGIPNTKYTLSVSPLDCSGCGICANVCPSKNKALIMQELQKEQIDKMINEYNTVSTLNKYSEDLLTNIKNSQFKTPYFEFSGACAGCGETPYLKLISQLYGDHMLIANATGCSSIYSGSFPSTPYTKDKDGFGPSWASSLFEDNAEFGLGIAMSRKSQREQYLEKLNNLDKNSLSNDINKILTKFLSDPDNTSNAKQCILDLRNISDDKNNTFIKSDSDKMLKESVWIIGGDGWAYDIGYGGLDHVFASGQNVNILILDTECYSNTGGQTSKSTPASAIAKFSEGGKELRKKDILASALNYEDIYVANISLSGDPIQALKSIIEAEKYEGVSVICAYSPCINHGLDMSKVAEHQKLAVQTGYTTLFRYHPESGMQIDSNITADIEDFYNIEERFKKLSRYDNNRANKLQKKCTENTLSRRENLEKIKDK